MKKNLLKFLHTLFCFTFLVTGSSLFGSIEEKNLDLIQQSVKQVDFENPILLDMPRGEKKNLMVNMIRSSLKQALADTDKIEVVTLYTKMITSTTCEEAVSLNLDLLPVIEQTSLAIAEELKSWNPIIENKSETNIVEIIAKVTDSIIEGCLRPAVKSGTRISSLSQSIAFGTASPFMKSPQIPYETLIKVSKGINYGIPYKFIYSVMNSVQADRQPKIIQEISKNTAFGTIAAAIDSKLEYEEIVYAATDAFSSSVITIASQKNIPLKRIAALTKSSSQGIMTGTVEASTQGDLPFEDLGAVMITRVEGKVRVERTSSEDPLTKEQIQNGSYIYQDHSLITGDNGSVTLLFSNGTITDLEPNSKLVIKKFTQDPFDLKIDKLSELKREPSNSQTDMNLEYGNLVFNVKKLNRGSYMNITSPLGNASIKGTTGKYSVQVDESGKATGGIDLVRGAIDFGARSTGSSTSSSTGVNVSNGQTSQGNEVISIQPGQNIAVDSSTSSVKVDQMAPNQAKEISQVTLKQDNTAGEQGITQITQIVAAAKNAASVEVTSRVSETSRVVASGLGGAGIEALSANGIEDSGNLITASTAEGIATGCVIASKALNLNFLDVAYNVSVGNVQGAATKTFQANADIEGTIEAIGNGQVEAMISDELTGLFTDSQLLALGNVLEEGLGDGLGDVADNFPQQNTPFDNFDKQNSPETLATNSNNNITSFSQQSGGSSSAAVVVVAAAPVVIIPSEVIADGGGGGGGGETSPISRSEVIAKYGITDAFDPNVRPTELANAKIWELAAYFHEFPIIY